jgi:integrase
MTNIDFRTYAPEYKQYVKDSKLAANTKDKRINMVNNFVEYCDDNKVILDTEEFYESVDKLEQYFENTSVHGVKVSAIRDFIDYIGKQEDTKTSVELEKIKDMITLSRLKDEDEEVGKIDEEELKNKLITEEELKAAKQHMDEKTRILVDFMHYSAVRPGEAVALTPEMLDEEENSFEVTATYSEGKMKLEGDPIQNHPKHGSFRTIKIPSKIFDKVMDWIERNEIGESERVWKSYRSDVYRPIKKAFNKAEVRMEDGSSNVTPHWFRHNGCSRLIDNSNNRKEDVQKHMGHSSIEITEHYEHIDSSEVVDVDVE